MGKITDRGFITRITQPNFLLAVQMGLVPGFSVVSLLAGNPNLSLGEISTVWYYGTVESTYRFSTSGQIDTLSSSNSGDNQFVLISGLDFTTWKQVDQVIQLQGQSKVALETPLIRVNKMFNVDTTRTSGDVYLYENTDINSGVPIDTSLVRSFFSFVEQDSLTGVYTVPSGKTGFFISLFSSLAIKQTASVIITGSARINGGVFMPGERFSLNSSGTTSISTLNNTFQPFPEKTDLITTADSNSNGVAVTATLNMLLVDNDLISQNA